MMTTPVVAVKPDTEIGKVAEILHERQFNGVPVVSDEGVVMGMITERELFSADYQLYLPGYVKALEETKFAIGGNKELPYVAQQITKTAAKDVMNQDLYFAQPEMTVEQMAQAFRNYDVNPIPVTDSANHLLGIVSRSDLIKLLVPLDSSSPSPQKPISHHVRRIDNEMSYVHNDIRSRFAYVTKFRANIWITTATVLFVVGFVSGIIYVANPQIFSEGFFALINRIFPK